MDYTERVQQGASEANPLLVLYKISQTMPTFSNLTQVYYINFINSAVTGAPQHQASNSAAQSHHAVYVCMYMYVSHTLECSNNCEYTPLTRQARLFLRIPRACMMHATLVTLTHTMPQLRYSPFTSLHVHIDDQCMLAMPCACMQQDMQAVLSLSLHNLFISAVANVHFMYTQLLFGLILHMCFGFYVIQNRIQNP